MVKKIIFGMLFLLMVATLVSATNTEINVKTLANHKVWIYVYGDGEIMPIDTFNAEATNGEVSYTHSSAYDEIEVSIKLTKDGKVIMSPEKFGTFDAGQPLYLQAIPGDLSSNYKADEEVCAEDKLNFCESESDCTTVNGFWYDEKCNAEEKVEPAVEETPVEKQVEENNEGSITGLAVFDSVKDNAKTIIYYVIGILVIAGLLIFVFKMRNRVPKSKPEVSFAPKTSNNTDPELIANLENKIKDAQRQLNLIKNEEKVKAAEARLRKDQEELERLKQGDF